MPGDATVDLIRNLVDGKEKVDEEPHDVIDGRDTSHGSEVLTTLPSPVLNIPSVITRVLNSPSKDELIAIAASLDPDNKRKHTVIFHTPIGEVRCSVDWTGNDPSELLTLDRLIIIKVRSSEVTFRPAPGAECEISFEGYVGRTKVLCLDSPPPIYPGVDLLCFLPQTNRMEKSGVVRDGAPSAVSGAPSDHVDEESGEAVAGVEKSAGVKDFDKARETHAEDKPE